MKKSFHIALFAYDFPHRKTIDFIDKIYDCGYTIDLILAAYAIPIKSPKSFFQLNSDMPKSSVQDKAKQYKIPLYQVKHNSAQSKDLLKKYHINFGIISGARILDHDIIMSIKYGILNFHPGLLPQIRGLDSILWSIHKDVPIGVTAHLINDKIDAGFLIYKKKISIVSTDNLQSLYEKNYQLQLDLMSISLNLVFSNHNFSSLKMGDYNPKMSYQIQKELNEKIVLYINKHSDKDESKN